MRQNRKAEKAPSNFARSSCLPTSLGLRRRLVLTAQRLTCTEHSNATEPPADEKKNTVTDMANQNQKLIYWKWKWNNRVKNPFPADQKAGLLPPVVISAVCARRLHTSPPSPLSSKFAASNLQDLILIQPRGQREESLPQYEVEVQIQKFLVAKPNDQVCISDVLLPKVSICTPTMIAIQWKLTIASFKWPPHHILD